MDASKARDVDLSAVPQIQRQPEAESWLDVVAEREPKARPQEAAKLLDVGGLSSRQGRAIAAISVVAMLALDIFAAPVDPNAAGPGALVTTIVDLSILALLATPLMALARTRGAALAGLAGAMAVLGLQAQCFIGGHTGFFATPFLAINAAMVGLVAVCAASLRR